MSLFSVHRLAVLLVAFALVAAACGTDPDGVEATTEGPSPTAEPSPTEEPAQVTEASEPEEDEEEEEEEPTPTPTPEPTPVWPLTGLPIEEGQEELAQRPALISKTDNAPQARPQVGLNDADMVLEILVEGITRLASVFHAGGSDPVGPMRSARISDVNIAPAFGRPLYATSGGNNEVMANIAQAEAEGKLTIVDVNRATPDYFRDNSGGRFAPHNLFTNTSALFARAPADASPPPQMFEYRDEGEALPGEAAPVPGVRIRYTGGLIIEYVWDPATEGWLRWQRGTPHVAADGIQVAPPNVVILSTPYLNPSSPAAQTLGESDAFTLTDGHIMFGKWTRPDPFQPWSVFDANGDPVRLTPGQTWLALPGGSVELLDAPTAEALLASRA